LTMQPRKNTSGVADALAKAKALAETIGLEQAIARAGGLVDQVRANLVLAKSAALLEQLEECEVKLLPIDKAAKDQQVVFGIVAEPNSVDAHNDTIRAAVVEKAAHNWLAKFQIRGLMHKTNISAKVQIYESYIAPVNLKIGGQKVKKGTWLLMYKILDKKIWKKVKSGELTGFSLGGFGRRVKLRSSK